MFRHVLRTLVPLSRMLLSLLAFLASLPIIKSKYMSLFFMLPLSFESLLGMFSNSTVWKYAPLLKNLVQSWVNLTLVLSFFPLLRKISLTWLINSWGFLLLWIRDGASLTSWISAWFSHTFLRGMFLLQGCSALNISMPSPMLSCEVLLGAWDASCRLRDALGGQ